MQQPDRSEWCYIHPAGTTDWRCEGPTGDALDFHRELPGYKPTPLVDAPSLATELAVGRCLIKDESARFDLASFKFLGASWATLRAVAARTGYTGPNRLDRLRGWVGSRDALTLIAATDGNHGRAVARMARYLGLGSRIYVPDVVPGAIVSRIDAEGARTSIVRGSYDDAIGAARRDAADDRNTVLVQDTSWDGYTQVPAWIVDGYATLFAETDAQLLSAGAGAPDLVAVPVGVGSLAQAAVRHYRREDIGDDPPRLLAVEPRSAACVLRSLQAGQLRTVETSVTIMNGLNCPAPSPFAWPQLAAGLDAAVAIDDEASLEAIDQLAAAGVRSGPSGAATLAGVRMALTGAGASERRPQLGVGEDAIVLCINTEGPVPADSAQVRPPQVAASSTQTDEEATP